MASAAQVRVSRRSGTQRGYAIARRGKFWEVRDLAGELVCIAVYKCGATEVVRRLSGDDEWAAPAKRVAAEAQPVGGFRYVIRRRGRGAESQA